MEILFLQSLWNLCAFNLCTKPGKSPVEKRLVSTQWDILTQVHSTDVIVVWPAINLAFSNVRMPAFASCKQSCHNTFVCTKSPEMFDPFPISAATQTRCSGTSGRIIFATMSSSLKPQYSWEAVAGGALC